MLGYIVLGSGFFIDIFISTFFQVRSIRNLLKQEKNNQDNEDIIDEDKRKQREEERSTEELA